MEVTCMTDKTKEKIFAERQDQYKQEKEDIFKEALEEYHDSPSKEKTQDNKRNP